LWSNSSSHYACASACGTATPHRKVLLLQFAWHVFATFAFKRMCLSLRTSTAPPPASRRPRCSARHWRRRTTGGASTTTARAPARSGPDVRRGLAARARPQVGADPERRAAAHLDCLPGEHGLHDRRERRELVPLLAHVLHHLPQSRQARADAAPLVASRLLAARFAIPSRALTCPCVRTLQMPPRFPCLPRNLAVSTLQRLSAL